MRAFIAALLPKEIKQELKEYVERIRSKWDGVKWEKYEKYHITMKFLGEIEIQELENIDKIVRDVLLKFSRFDLSISNFGAFPNLKNPRVLTIGFKGDENLTECQKQLEAILHNAGYEKESRVFIPHVTIGRIRGKYRFKGNLPIPPNTAFCIKEIAIMKSELFPDGSKYSVVSKYELQ